MHKFLALAAAASGLMLALAVNAAEIASPAAGNGAVATTPGTAMPAPPDPGRLASVSQVRASGPPIVLDAGKGTLIRLPRAAATVFIANPDVADVQIKSPLLIYLSAKTPGETVLYAVDSEDRVLLNAPVRVEHDLARVRQELSSIAPGENVAVASVDNSLVLSGRVSSAGRAEKVRSVAAAIAGETKGTVVNRLSVVTPNQVSIRVKVAEVNRQVLKTLGVNWSTLTPNHIGPLTTLSFQTTNPTAVAGNLAAELGLTFGGSSWLSQATVDALAQEGLVNVLAEPNLTATNGQPASFLAGGEFPVPVAGAAATAGGSATISVVFKKFGVSLDVVPTIIDAEHLNLKVRSEVSQLSTTGQVSVPLGGGFSVTIPALSVRRAETTVELGSGQSYALAGLLQNTDTQNITKVPMLGDIPIIGQLFRSQQFQRNETELVIIVTPYLVNPAPTVASLMAPNDGLAPTHDLQQIISEGSYRQTLPPPARGPSGPAGQGLVGTVGFRLD
jgi:pilus assembly protein CpaC